MSQPTYLPYYKPYYKPYYLPYYKPNPEYYYEHYPQLPTLPTYPVANPLAGGTLGFACAVGMIYTTVSRILPELAVAAAANLGVHPPTVQRWMLMTALAWGGYALYLGEQPLLM